MQNKRLLFSVIIKLLILSGSVLLVFVFFNSLFTGGSGKDTYQVKSIEDLPTASIDTSDMFKGQIRKVRWANKEVGVLLRQFTERLSDDIDFNNEKLHSALDKKLRSRNLEYFVYFNLGDSNNCPLFYSAGEFKDVCSSNKFDEAGRALNANPNSFRLKIPPHYFAESEIIIGKWQP